MREKRRERGWKRSGGRVKRAHFLPFSAYTHILKRIYGRFSAAVDKKSFVCLTSGSRAEGRCCLSVLTYDSKSIAAERTGVFMTV